MLPSSNKMSEDYSKNARGQYPESQERLAEAIEKAAKGVRDMINSDTATGIVEQRAEILKAYCLGYQSLYHIFRKFSFSESEFKMAMDSIYPEQSEDFDDMEF